MRHPACNTADHPLMGRREFLSIGSLPLFSLGLNAFTPSVGKAKAVIFLFQSGGPSQHETFDPKPDAPAEIRGEYSTTQTKIPSVRFCEYLPKLAARADRFSLVRTMHHVAGREFRNEHNSCTYLLHTGTTALPVGDTNASITGQRPGRVEWPAFGSLLSYSLENRGGFPSVVEIPRAPLMKYPGRSPGIVGPKYGRWGVDLAPLCRAPDAAGSCPNCFSHDDPNDPARAPGKGPKAWWDNSSCREPAFHLPDFNGLRVTWKDLQNREKLLEKIDAQFRALQTSAQAGTGGGWDAARSQALRLLDATRSGAGNPFDLSQEPLALRERYGHEEWGQGFLTARKLIEAGVRMVQVNMRGWDTHQNAFRDLKGKLLPSIDRALSALLDDLEERGLLQETLVVMCGEMGRTPRISPITAGGKNASGEVFTPGRHHWGDVFPCFFAGGGIQPGRVVGKTDSHAGLPASEAYTPADLAATIFHLMGIGSNRVFHDSQGKPYPVYQGEPIQPLLA